MKEKMKQFEGSIVQKKIDQIMVPKIYLQIILFLNSTFDICLSYKINRKFQTTIYECLQDIYMLNVIWSLIQDCIHNMNNK